MSLNRLAQKLGSLTRPYHVTLTQRGFTSNVYAAGIAARYSTSADDTRQRIEKLVKANKVVVFMKGTPDAPKCGFSNAVMQVLNMHGVKEFSSYNVLDDEEIRQGIKDFSNWPTIPQVYINGDFVGGCDIVIEMHQKGELVEELQKVGIRSALLDKPPPTK